MPDSEFGVTFTCTGGYTKYLAAAIASLRSHNKNIPVRCVLDARGQNQFGDTADALDVTITLVDPQRIEEVHTDPSWKEWVHSRLIKIGSVADPGFDPFLFLDSDVLVCDDIDNLRAELEPLLEERADIFMLLRRPDVWTLWGDRANYFVDPSFSRGAALQFINDAFGVDLPESCLDEMDCWNSGVIFGKAKALELVGERWRALYRTMLVADGGENIIPRDQLALWIALWELRSMVRVAELPRRWNFMAGLGVRPGSPGVSGDALEEASVLHLAQNKSDPWALERLTAALTEAGLEPRLRGTEVG